jgi:hypothetical protein
VLATITDRMPSEISWVLTLMLPWLPPIRISMVGQMGGAAISGDLARHPVDALGQAGWTLEWGGQPQQTATCNAPCLKRMAVCAGVAVRGGAGLVRSGA